jgi:uncharacterized repeat protein (TIGR01451 family)
MARLIGSIRLAAMAVALVALTVGNTVSAQAPPGNNGTIKVDGVPFDDIPNNEPHIGCNFQIDFYGYDQGDLNATVTFEAVPPTPPSGSQTLLTDTVFIGEDDNSGGGSEAGLDASRTYTLDLSGIAPGLAGVHVRLTINAPGSQGADTKFKDFWVTGCATASADVSIVKTLTTPGPYTAGGAVTYTLVVANAGPSAATGIQVTDTPANLAITTVSGSGCAGLPCTIANLAAGASTTITVTATIGAAGAFDNSAAATAAQPDPNVANNTDNAGNGDTASAVAIPAGGPLGLVLLALALCAAGVLVQRGRGA